MFVEKNYQDLSKIQEMLDLSSNSNELILFQDSKGDIWQIIQRSDLKTVLHEQIEESLQQSSSSTPNNNNDND